jgi:hypothetical protein
MMIRRKPMQPIDPRTLAQQQSDFTAEGSAPPGKVAVSGPATVRETTTLPAPTRVQPVRKGPPVGRSRWQR